MVHARLVLEDNAFVDLASPIQTGNMLVVTRVRSPATVEQVERVTGGPATLRNLTVVRTLAQRWGPHDD